MENRKNLNAAGQEEYLKPRMELVSIRKNDVITTSCPNDCPNGEYWGEEDPID